MSKRNPRQHNPSFRRCSPQRVDLLLGKPTPGQVHDEAREARLAELREEFQQTQRRAQELIAQRRAEKPETN